MLSGPYPAITQAQIGAVALAVVGQFVAWGWLDKAREQLAVSIGTFVLAAVWKAADAYLRGSRNRHAAGADVPATPPASAK